MTPRLSTLLELFGFRCITTGVLGPSADACWGSDENLGWDRDSRRAGRSFYSVTRRTGEWWNRRSKDSVYETAVFSSRPAIDTGLFQSSV